MREAAKDRGFEMGSLAIQTQAIMAHEAGHALLSISTLNNPGKLRRLQQQCRQYVTLNSTEAKDHYSFLQYLARIPEQRARLWEKSFITAYYPRSEEARRLQDVKEQVDSVRQSLS